MHSRHKHKLQIIFLVMGLEKFRKNIQNCNAFGGLGIPLLAALGH